MSKSLPPGWRRVRLGEFVKERNGFVTIDDSKTYRRITVRLHNKGIEPRDEVPGFKVKTKKQKVVKAGDLVVAEIDAKVGGFGIAAPETEGAIVSSHYFLFTVDQSVCELGYLDACIRKGMLHKQVTAVGSTNYAAIRPGQVLDYRVPLPPLSQQKRIAAALRGVDEAIKANEEVITRTLALKKSLADELLRRGLPGAHTRFKDSALGRIPEAWEVRRLDEVARVERGKFTHRPRNEPSMYGGATPFVQTGDITASGWYLHGYSQTLSERGLTVSRLFPAGTILLAIAQTRGNIGATTITRFPVAFPDSVVGITPNAGFTPEYLLTALEHAQRRIIGAATESAQANLSLDLLRPVPIEVPTKAERELITKAVKDIEQCLERAHENLKSLRVLRDGLLPSLLLAGSTETGATQRREV